MSADKIYNILEQAGFINSSRLFVKQKSKLQPAFRIISDADLLNRTLLFFQKIRAKILFGAGGLPILLSVFLIITGCHSTKIAENTTEKKYIMYPEAPDTARIQYLTKISSTLDLNQKKTPFKDFLLGREKVNALVKPYGMAIHKGKIYVCDMYGGGVSIWDLEKKTFGLLNTDGGGKLRGPVNCFVDENGDVYVADPLMKQVVVFDAKGNYIKSLGEKQNFIPNDVCVQGNKIFIANKEGNNILVYSKDSTKKLLYSFPDSTKDVLEKIQLPTNIAINNDKIYVSNFGTFQIKYYSLEGKFIDTIGSHGVNLGQFSKPKGIAVDRESILYAVDADFDNVQLFNEKGQLLLFFGDHYNGPGDLYTPAKVIIDYDNLKYFQSYVNPAYDLKYLIFVTSQYGPDKLNVYGRIEPKKPALK